MTDNNALALEALKASANYIDALGGDSKPTRSRIAALESAAPAAGEVASGERKLPAAHYLIDPATHTVVLWEPTPWMVQVGESASANGHDIAAAYKAMLGAGSNHPAMMAESPFIVGGTALMSADIAAPPAPSATSAEPKGAREAAAWNLLTEAMLDEFLEDYEMVGVDEEGRDGSYTPSERERGLIKDAVMGLLCEVQERAYSTLPAVQPEAETSAEKAVAGLRAMVAQLKRSTGAESIEEGLCTQLDFGLRNLAVRTDAPVAEPVAWIVNSVKNPSRYGQLVHPFDIGSYQREALTRTPLYTRPPAPEEGKDAARDVLALAIINAARTAMDESVEAENDAKDIVIPSHWAASLSLCLDEYDAAMAQGAR